MTWTPRRERFRQLLAGDACLSPCAVFDPVSARIAEDLGYEAVFLPGSTTSLVVLGAPDITLLTLSELAEQTRRICRASTLPLMVDADHGYGNALNVRRTVEELENAGAASISLLDTSWPACFGSPKTDKLIPVEEGVGKLRAAINARRDPSLVIVGRTDAASITNFDDAIARVRAYAAAGVDAIFLLGVKTRKEVDALAAAVKLPIILGAVSQELKDTEYLKSRRVRIVTQGSVPIMAAIQAIRTTMKALRDGTPPGEIPNLASKELMKQVMRDDDYTRWMRDYLM